MKKFLSIIITAFIIILNITILTACSPNKKVNLENTIYTKQEAIQYMKQLLNINDLYFFDCNFTDTPSINIEDVSYNVTITGTLNFNKESEKYYIDLNKYAEVALVTNYRISTINNCFGFSIISHVMKGKTDKYENDKYVSTEPAIIYNQTTYSTIQKLYNEGTTTYGSYQPTDNIKVPTNFYPCKTSKLKSIESKFIDIEKNGSNTNVKDIPVKILTHYASSNDQLNNNNNATIKTLINYFKQYSYYSNH